MDPQRLKDWVTIHHGSAVSLTTRSPSVLRSSRRCERAAHLSTCAGQSWIWTGHTTPYGKRGAQLAYTQPLVMSSQPKVRTERHSGMKVAWRCREAL